MWGYAAWTGQEMIFWGYSGGGRYNPATDTWTAMSTTNAPLDPRTTIWTGQDLISANFSNGLSGLSGSSSPTATKTAHYKRYNPTTNSWTSISSGLNFSYFYPYPTGSIAILLRPPRPVA